MGDRRMKMLRGIALYLILLIFLCIGLVDARTPRHRLIEMHYIVRLKDLPASAKEIDIWIPYPVSDECQRIMDMRVESPVPTSIYYDPEWGNAILYLKLRGSQVSPCEVRMNFKVLRREDLHEDLKGLKRPRLILGDLGPYQRFLAPSQYAVIDDFVRELAHRITKDKQDYLAKARAIYDFILTQVDYDKRLPGWGRGDTQRLCLMIKAGKIARGNCTDFHSLFSSLMRAIGIPVVFEMGYPLKPDKDDPAGTIGGYHCWARFFLPGQGWIPVDISEADKHPERVDYYFGNICENRVRFSRGRDILLEPPQQGKRLNFFGPDPYIEVNGLPFKGYVREIAYRDLP